MDHIPYPVSTSVPPVEIPFLLETVRGSDVPFTGLEKTEQPDETLTETKYTQDQHHTAGLLPEADDGSIKDLTLDYWKYPQEQGWTVTDALSWWTSDAEETARRAQKFMYLELLQRFLGHRIDPSSLARKDEDNEKILLDSNIVPELLSQWLARQHTPQLARDYISTSSGNPLKRSHILSLLARVLLECNKLDDLPEPSQSTALAIRVLVETLTNAIHDLAHLKVTENRDIQKSEHNSLLERRFLGNGWCPFQIARLWGQYSPLTTYYLSSLSREPTFGGVKHNQCDETRCMTTSIDPATYEHQHAESCSTESDACRMVGVQSSEIAECIKSGHIPLIKFEESVDGVLRPSIIASHSDLRYVALSHVWSGGLGNVNANSIYSCQLRKLQRLLQTIRENGDDDLDRDRGSRKTRGAKRDLRASLRMKPLPQQPVLLWMDTLCVPVGVEHAQTRQMAITQMAQIYVQAQCVLVVDPELQKMKYKDLPDEELFASVQCSSWNSRSWTFQEAAMARVFYVQFLDGYSIIDKRWHDFMKRIDKETASETTTSQISKGTIDMRPTLMMDVSNWFGTMPVMTKIRSYDARTLMTRSEDWQNFVRVWNGLRTRSTTKSDDLYGIIAIMVDLTAYEILRLDPRERMKAILRSQSTLPISLLYQDCPRILGSNGQPMWAPCQIAGGHLDMNSGYMSLHDDGLYIDARREGVAQYSWPQVYGFSCEQPLPSSFILCLADRSSILSVTLCLVGNVDVSGLVGPWLILVNEKTAHRDVAQASRGTLLRRTSNDGSMLVAAYTCPIKVSIEAETKPNEQGKNLDRRDSADQYIVAQSIRLENHVVKIETGTLQSTDWSVRCSTSGIGCDKDLKTCTDGQLDITSWYKPRIRISKQLFSPWIVVRNMSKALEIGAIMLTSVLYQIAIIGCAVHHRQDLVRQILYFLVPRYFSLLVEGYWIGSLVVSWDKARMFQWSLQLYGESEVGSGRKAKKVLLHPVLITKAIPVIAGSVSLGLYCNNGWILAKWIGTIAFVEIGVRLVYTCGFTVVGYILTGWPEAHISRADVSDLPEDMTNCSRDWEENNKNSWWTQYVLKGERHG